MRSAFSERASRQEDLLGGFVAEEQKRRRGFVVVELRDEGGEDVGRLVALGMGGEEAAIAVVAAATDEKNLHAALPGFLVQGDDIRIRQAGGVDDIATLDMREAPDSVADRGGALEFQVVGGLLHGGGQIFCTAPDFPVRNDFACSTSVG